MLGVKSTTTTQILTLWSSLFHVTSMTRQINAFILTSLVGSSKNDSFVLRCVGKFWQYLVFFQSYASEQVVRKTEVAFHLESLADFEHHEK